MGRYEIEGKVVLITGAGNGIGRDVARRLGPMGAKLALVDLDAEGVERAAAEIDGEAEPFVADVSERDSIHAAIVAARERFGGIDAEIPGLDDFEGKLIHSARWDHDYRYETLRRSPEPAEQEKVPA